MQGPTLGNRGGQHWLPANVNGAPWSFVGSALFGDPLRSERKECSCYCCLCSDSVASDDGVGEKGFFLHQMQSYTVQSLPAHMVNGHGVGTPIIKAYAMCLG